MKSLSPHGPKPITTTSHSHDSISQTTSNPQTTPHSSASYKQELMDASLLLDNINEALTMWDTQTQNTHSLQPQYNMLFSPSLSTIIINNTPSKFGANKGKKKRKKENKISSSLPKKNIEINAYETFYMKDDSSIKHHKSREKHRSKHNKHRDNVIARTPLNIRNMDEIPSFLTAHEQRLRLLAEMIELKRNELERISVRHDHTLSCIIDLYISATENVLLLRKQYGDLSSFAFELSREGQLRITRSDMILSTLHNVEEQRKNLLNKIDSPSWEIKHHFHILSFEHFRGNQQPHLLEIAQVLPSRLQIAAISHHSTMLNHELLREFNIARKERELLYKKLGQIDKKRNLTQCHLKDYKKMMSIIKKNIGEKRLNKLKKEREKEVETKAKAKKGNKNKRVVSNGIVSKAKDRDRFRRQYLGDIGIRKSEKKQFNLNHFVSTINRFLAIGDVETKQELDELKNHNDLVNPITGTSNSSMDKETVKDDGDNEDSEGTQNEEIDTKTEKKDLKKKLTEKLMRKKLTEKKVNRNRFVFKEKKQKKNILDIIDSAQYVINTEERTEKENIIKTVYSVELRVTWIEEKNSHNHDHVMDLQLIEGKMDNVDEDDGYTCMDDSLDIISLNNGMNGNGDKEDVIDAPHRDWSVLAKHLKDSSKEQARRKQILKQLERILHVREGLQLGFDQLKEIYDNHQKSQIQTKK